MDALVESTLVKKVAVGLGRGGKPARHRDTGAGQVADHLSQGSILAPHPLDIVVAELIEGDYVLNQGASLHSVCWINRSGRGIWRRDRLDAVPGWWPDR